MPCIEGKQGKKLRLEGFHCTFHSSLPNGL